MHRTNFIARPAIWSMMLSLALAGSMLSTQALAQPPAAVEIVPVGGTKTISVKPAKVQKVNVAKPGIVRVEVSVDAQAVLLTGETPGTTQVTIVDSQGRTQLLNVVVQTDVEFIRYLLKRTVPTANIEPVPVGSNVIILTGTVVKAEDIPIILATAQSVAGQGVINGMRVGGVVQVQLDVVIAQVSRNELRKMSFSFFNTGKHHFLGSVLTTPSALTSVLTMNVADATARATANSNLLLGFVNDEQGFFGFLDALRNEGVAKFLSEPRLSAISGQEASVLSGGKLAVPQPSGLGTNSVRFQEFGTRLRFLPIVLGTGKIALNVEISVNSINQALGTTIQGTTVPGFNTQSAYTQVELEDGQTVAIAGLIETQINATTSKVPVLGDIPFLNTAFSTKNYNFTETELLIVVTPHLVDPLACNQLPKYFPGQETRVVDDFELFLEGIIEAPRGQRRVFPDGRHYQAAYLNGPSSAAFPCGVKAATPGYGLNRWGSSYCGPNGCGMDGCASGNCGGIDGTSGVPGSVGQPVHENLPKAPTSQLRMPKRSMQTSYEMSQGSVPVIYEEAPRRMPAGPPVGRVILPDNVPSESFAEDRQSMNPVPPISDQVMVNPMAGMGGR